MIVPDNTTLSIKTGVNACGSIFERKYSLVLHGGTDEIALISLKSVDKTPSGYNRGGTNFDIFEHEEFKIPKEKTVKSWMCSLIIEHDLRLKHRNGNVEFNKSNELLRKKVLETIK
jgi:hypothetical protein